MEKFSPSDWSTGMSGEYFIHCKRRRAHPIVSSAIPGMYKMGEIIFLEAGGGVESGKGR